jgi:peptidoglycan-associated lipoprotein
LARGLCERRGAPTQTAFVVDRKGQRAGFGAWLAGLIAVMVVVAGSASCARRPATSGISVPAPGGREEIATAPPALAPAPAPRAPAGPPAGRLPVREFKLTVALPPIGFEFDRAIVDPPEAAVLEASARWLRDHPRQLVLIEGHCDERGTNEYNLALGERRAWATRQFLTRHGVAADRITIVSYGEERPRCTEKSEACWTLNRRAVFLTAEP